MDPRERWDDVEEIHHTAAERKQSRIWTALPCKVLEDSDGFTVQLQPTIKGKNAAGGGSDDEMPTLDKVPVVFTAGGGFTITHPVKKGDEGIAVFSSRCIDGWWRDGGVQPALEPRMHNLSDAMYIPGIRSTPRKLGGNGQGGGAAQMDATQGTPASTTSVQVRSDDGKYYIELAPQGVVNIVCDQLNVKAATKIHFETATFETIVSSKTSHQTPTADHSGQITAQQKITTADVVTAAKDIVSGANLRAAADVLALAGFPGVKLAWQAIQAIPHIELPPAPPLPQRPRVAPEALAFGPGQAAGFAAGQGYAAAQILAEVDGTLTVTSEVPSGVGAEGDQFSITGAIATGFGAIEGARDLLNQVHSVVNIIDSLNFTAALSAFPGEIGQIIGNPIMSAAIHMIGHGHLGVMLGKAISLRPITGR